MCITSLSSNDELQVLLRRAEVMHRIAVPYLLLTSSALLERQAQHSLGDSA